jgi:hypothetical protein
MKITEIINAEKNNKIQVKLEEIINKPDSMMNVKDNYLSWLYGDDLTRDDGASITFEKRNTTLYKISAVVDGVDRMFQLEKYSFEEVKDYIGKEDVWIKSLSYDKDTSYSIYDINADGERISSEKHIKRISVSESIDLHDTEAESLFENPKVKNNLNKNDITLEENKENKDKILFLKKIINRSVGEKIDITQKETDAVGITVCNHSNRHIVKENQFLLNNPEAFDIMVRIEKEFEETDFHKLFNMTYKAKSFYELKEKDKFDILKNIEYSLDNGNSLRIKDLFDIASRNINPSHSNNTTIKTIYNCNIYNKRGNADQKFLKDNNIDIFKVNALLLTNDIVSDMVELSDLLKKEKKIRQSILDNLNENKNRFLELFAEENPNTPFKATLIKEWVNKKESELSESQFKTFKNESLILMDYLRSHNKEKDQDNINKILDKNVLHFHISIKNPKIKDLINKTNHFLSLEGVTLSDKETFNVEISKEEEKMVSFLKSIMPKSGSYDTTDIAEVLVDKIIEDNKKERDNQLIKSKKIKHV